MSQPRTLELARARTFANLGVHGGDRSVAQEGKERRGGGGYEENIGPYSLREYSLCILERVWPITRRVDNGTVVFSRGILHALLHFKSQFYEY